MTLVSGLGIGLSLVFGCLLLALIAEIYYLLWWKKQVIINNNNNINHTKEIFYLFCWDKPHTTTNTISTTTTNNNNVISNTNHDLEMGLKSLGEECIESEIMRLHNLSGPPRFLFTIKEETKEDLECDNNHKSLSDFMFALDDDDDDQSPKNLLGHDDKNNYNNPLFESSSSSSSSSCVEAELFKLRSSPPPKFKFLRDAEEKLYRKLVEEAQKSGMVFKEGVLDDLRGDFGCVEEEKGDGV